MPSLNSYTVTGNLCLLIVNGHFANILCFIIVAQEEADDGL